jgi:endonuclease YncB( thermonuclease family)
MRFHVLPVLAAVMVGGIFVMGMGIEAPAAAAPAVAVVDGDTLELDGEIIRLANIDAPEIGQPCDDNGRLTTCGRDAAFALRKLASFDNRVPACEKVAGTETFTCRVGTTDLAEALLAAGYVTALADAPLHYRLAEARAREVPLGIWKGRFVTPAEWRAGRRLPAERAVALAAQAPTELPWRVAGVQILPEPISHGDPCVIKGVATAAAGRLYFSPLDAAYAGIDVEAAHGRTFCSVDEARGAGWRHGR